MEDNYITIETSCPHQMSVHIKKLLNGQTELMRDQDVFLETFRNTYPDQAEEFEFLRFAYEQKIVDDFLNIRDTRKWEQRLAVKKAMRILTNRMTERNAVMVVESLMCTLGWSISLKMERMWEVKEGEESDFHDTLKITPKNFLDIKGDNEDKGNKESYFGTTAAGRAKNIESTPPPLEKNAHDGERRVLSVLDQTPEQVKFYKIMSASQRVTLRRALCGDIHSQCAMGDFYSKGSLSHRDYEEALCWYEAAAGKGYMRASFEIGRIYDIGEGGIDGGKEEAIKIYSKLADKGYPTAEAALGMKYRLGDGVKEDLPRAKELLLRAAKQNHVSAMRQLADLYMSIGNYDEALTWYSMGAKYGDKYCCLKTTKHKDGGRRTTTHVPKKRLPR